MQEWDTYWAKDQKPHNYMYDRIAVFYRKYIIKPYLFRYCSKYFSGKSLILHAGCGGGQVEEGLDESVTILGLDISPNALALYRRCHDRSCLMRGDIISIGLKDETVDGIYNLGVMEHFSEEQIQNILREFHRVLKKNGTIVLFWPPRFGLTVIALKGVHFMLNSILRKNVALHPPEPSLIESRAQVEQIVKKAGFDIKETGFSPRDGFTYMVVVIEKAARHPEIS